MSKEKSIVKALQNEEIMEKLDENMKELIDGKPVNVNPIKEEAKVEMRLFRVGDKYYDTLNEAIFYCRTFMIPFIAIDILDYIREFAGKKDVIRKQNLEDTNSMKMMSVLDNEHYIIYNNERSIYRGKYTWELNEGNVKIYYKGFKEKGIIFENNIYEELKKKAKTLKK